MGDAEPPDPAAVETLPELARALKRLCEGRSYAALDRAINPAAGKTRLLPAATLSDMMNGRSVPTQQTLIRFLTACGLADDEQQAWLAAWARVDAAKRPTPAGMVRVSEARPRLLGVHESIQVRPDAAGLPAYVPRDFDPEVCSAITVAAERGGFVLLVGNSSVGKTRALFEAVRVVLPEWWLLHPADAVAMREFAAAPATRTVIWLDELQRYLDHPVSKPAAAVRTLIAAGAVVVATMWQDEYGRRIVGLRPDQSDQSDRDDNDRELLRMARVIDVPDVFTEAERERAEGLAGDERIKVALGSSDSGFTQVLAAGPELVRWWTLAPDAYGKAVITAALDAQRVGCRAPLSRAFLEAAAPVYLPPAEQAIAPEDWLDQGLRYATVRLHGAASALRPVPAAMGRIGGYTVADFLRQHAVRERRTVPVPAEVWQAIVDHHHPDDTLLLAESADRRGQEDHALALYRLAAAHGLRFDVCRMADLLVERGLPEEAETVLRRAAHGAGSYAFAVGGLVRLLVQQDRADEALDVWRKLAYDADIDQTNRKHALYRLRTWLGHLGRVDELVTHADDGDHNSSERLGELLYKQGRLSELRERADAGDRQAPKWLASALKDRGAIDELRSRAAAGERAATCRLADLLSEQARLEELRELARCDIDYVTDHLAQLLVRLGRADEAADVWRAQSDAGVPVATMKLGDLLLEQGRIDEVIAMLRPRAAAGDCFALARLGKLLAEQGAADEAIAMLRQRNSETGDTPVAEALSDVLVAQGQVDEALAMWREYGSKWGGWLSLPRMAEVMAAAGRTAALRELAMAGDPQAAERLATLLTESGQADEAFALLRDRADAGHRSIAEVLVRLLAEQGRFADLRIEVAAGTHGAWQRLKKLTTPDRG